LAEEYLNHVTMQSFAELASAFERTKATHLERKERVDLSGPWSRFSRCFVELCKREVQLQKAQVLEERSESPSDLVYRMSQYKKFFQSQMFIDVEKKATIRQLSEPLAIMGALTSGLGAAGIEFFSRPGWWGFGLKSTFVVSFGILLYVLRDRVKDQAKAFFTRKASKVLPDYEHRLTVDGRTIGKIKEWFSLSASSKLPGPIRSLRAAKSLTEVEEWIPEDVIQYKSVFLFGEQAHEVSRGDQSFQVSIRMNFERFLKNIDDSEKDFLAIDHDGSISPVHAKRKYYSHVCVVSRPTGADGPALQFLYRVAFDKRGIESVEEVSKTQSQPVAERKAEVLAHNYI
jgi:hypothetical protein